MRITSTMTSSASLEAGMSLTGNSLVNYLNGDDSDSLVNSLGENHHSTAKALSKGKYEKMKEAAERLEQYADSLIRQETSPSTEKRGRAATLRKYAARWKKWFPLTMRCLISCVRI